MGGIFPVIIRRDVVVRVTYEVRRVEDDDRHEEEAGQNRHEL